MDYSWLASKENALLRMANILYKDKLNGNTQLNWDYDHASHEWVFSGFRSS